MAVSSESRFRSLEGAILSPLFADTTTPVIDLAGILERVAGQPLSYVALLVLILAWVVRWYFLFTVRRLTEFKSVAGTLPEKSRLTALQMLVLGFPDNLTEKRLTLLRWRYSLIAFLSTLLAIIVISALVANAISIRAQGTEAHSEIRGAINQLRDTAMEGVLAQQSVSDELALMRNEIAQTTGLLRRELEREKQRNVDIRIDLAELRSEANIGGRENPELAKFATKLEETIKRYEKAGGPPTLVVIEAKNTLNNAEVVTLESTRGVTFQFVIEGAYQMAMLMNEPIKWQTVSVSAGGAVVLSMRPGKIYRAVVIPADAPETSYRLKFVAPVGSLSLM